MTKDERRTNTQCRKRKAVARSGRLRASGFGLRHSFVLRPSSLVLVTGAAARATRGGGGGGSRRAGSTAAAPATPFPPSSCGTAAPSLPSKDESAAGKLLPGGAPFGKL